MLHQTRVIATLVLAFTFDQNKHLQADVRNPWEVKLVSEEVCNLPHFIFALLYIS